MFQMRQVSYLVKEIEDFGSKNGLTSESSTRIILGDFNVETLSPVCAHLRQAGYFSGMGTALEVEDLEARSDDLLVAGADAPSPSPEHERTAYKQWVSHRTHRAEDLGVDHVYIKPQVERGAAGADSGVFVSDARVLPISLPAESWPLDFRVSDHRPVRVSIVFARVSNEADWVGWN
jgi:endonuclease/exonuclease/phosphatase family metal-dependent hydrolase